MLLTSTGSMNGLDVRPKRDGAPAEPAADKMLILSIDHLSVSYTSGSQSVAALRDVSLQVKRGTRVAIVGESGSGKTTLALVIAGFLEAPWVDVSASKFEFDGVPLPVRRHQGRLPRRRPDQSMVFQDAMTSLDPVWTVGSQILAVLRSSQRLEKGEAQRQALDWLSRVGLSDPERVMRARPYELSGGMQQRVMVAIALCTRPKLLIADEPTSALDASLAHDVMRLLVELTADVGTTLLIVSHDIALCQKYVNHIVIMRNGRIVEEGLPDALLEAPRHPYTRGLLQCIPTLESAWLDRLPTLEDV